mmetsp:Transcript_16787/g.45737  ORF Transcript_16787/g.45737 Transcript_16787/m.45737 type:complete len:452 (+) Transcript_16787:1042-2397(+)
MLFRAIQVHTVIFLVGMEIAHVPFVEAAYTVRTPLLYPLTALQGISAKKGLPFLHLVLGVSSAHRIAARQCPVVRGSIVRTFRRYQSYAPLERSVLGMTHTRLCARSERLVRITSPLTGLLSKTHALIASPDTSVQTFPDFGAILVLLATTALVRMKVVNTEPFGVIQRICGMRVGIFVPLVTSAPSQAPPLQHVEKAHTIPSLGRRMFRIACCVHPTILITILDKIPAHLVAELLILLMIALLVFVKAEIVFSSLRIVLADAYRDMSSMTPMEIQLPTDSWMESRIANCDLLIGAMLGIFAAKMDLACKNVMILCALCLHVTARKALKATIATVHALRFKHHKHKRWRSILLWGQLLCALAFVPRIVRIRSAPIPTKFRSRKRIRSRQTVPVAFMLSFQREAVIRAQRLVWYLPCPMHHRVRHHLSSLGLRLQDSRVFWMHLIHFSSSWG